MQSSNGRPGVDEPTDPVEAQSDDQVSRAAQDAKKDRAELADPGGLEGVLGEAAQDSRSGRTLS